MCAASRRSNFGDAAVFLERFVERARHIEVQIVGDGRRHGDRSRRTRLLARSVATRRWSRSRPRRHLRRAPPAVARQRDRSCRVGRLPVGGHGRVHRRCRHGRPRDGGDAWFLEVNTRLQVEHGVTELVRGVDLVEWMVRLGAGQIPAGFDSARVDSDGAGSGWAIEARLYAEDPLDASLPAPGSSPNSWCQTTCASTRGSTPAPTSHRSTTR